ncbi:hypothetical protein B0O99DRAFT_689958 [Bisporella sp. PMI_857]|nr:hypothetical protein B0O99DRAFT_689958 [Bisporella sp. PMI_857]
MDAIPYLKPHSSPALRFHQNSRSEVSLEVGEDPYRSPHTGWPDAREPVWGIENGAGSISEERLMGNVGVGNVGVVRTGSTRLSGRPKIEFSGILAAMLCAAFIVGVGVGVGIGVSAKKCS